MAWFRGVASAGCALTLAFALPGSAEADSWFGSDPTGDVELVTIAPDPKPCGTVTEEPRPNDTSHDITSLRVDHRRSVVVVDVDFRGLNPDRSHSTSIDLHTPVHTTTLSVDVHREASTGRVRAAVASLPRPLPPPDECGDIFVIAPTIPCPGLTPDWDSDLNRVRVVIPRSCIGDPGWVRVGASSYTIRGRGTVKVTHDRWQPTEDAPKFTPKVLRARF